MIELQSYRSRAFRRAAVVAGLAVAAVGAAHLAAWLTGAMSTDVWMSTITMKTNTSLCLTLGGIALVLLAPERPRTWARPLARLGASVMLVVGALTLFEHLAQYDVGIDQLIAHEPAGAAGVVSPNRMGVPGAVGLTLLGIALLLVARRPGPTARRAHHEVLALVAAIVALMVILGHLYHVDVAYGIADYAGSAWTTAVSLLMLAAGVLCARPDDGVMASVTADDGGGVVIRRLLLPTLILPVTLGWLRLAAENRGWFDTATGTALLVLVFVIAFSVILLLGGRAVSREAATRRHDADTMRRQLAEIRSIYDSAQIGLCVFDLDLRFLKVNQFLAEINGVPAADHIGKTVEEVAPALAPFCRALLERIRLTGGGATDVEFSGVTAARPGVERSWVEQWLPLKDASGQIVAINVVVEEVTERKRAEELRRQSEDRLSALVQASSQVIYRMSADWSELLEVRGGDLPARAGILDRRALAGYIHPADRRRVLQAVGDSVRTGRIFELEHRVVRRDGAVRWMGSRAVPLRDAAGDVREWFGAAADITTRRLAEEALREANARLDDADRRKDEFIALLAHELRNPLAPIRYVVPMLEREALGEPARRGVAIIGRQIDHLTRLVDDLLDISRIRLGKIELRRETVLLDSVVAAARETALPAILGGEHTLTTSVTAEPIRVHVDLARMTQAMTNLLNNSAKYTPRGGHIRIEADAREGQAVVRVRDNGIGIAAEALPGVFEMFRQVRRADTTQASLGTKEGLGIGLAFARQLVELHDGSLEAASPGLGQGAEFTIRLPIVADVPRHDAPAPAVPVSQHRHRLRVLIVDDNVDFVEMLALVVGAAGHDVRKAFGGAGALAEAEEFLPDVVLLDVGMPGMNGLDVARALRRRPDTTIAYLVAVTGWGDARDRLETQAAGFDAHMTKPTDPAAILQLLSELEPVGRRREASGHVRG